MTASKTGKIFNIQYFSVHDGPGIRTVIFLKGCPLRCIWCANPESQKSEIELAYQQSKCIGCGICQKVCYYDAIYPSDQDRINRRHCITCLACARNCPSGALYSIGEEREVGELLDKIEQDEVFYSNSQGGLTLSGGEPLMQSGFAIELLKEARRRHIHTAIETTGYVKWEVLREAARYLDFIFYDIKCVEEEQHIQFTHVSNKQILHNFEQLCKVYNTLPITVRTPVVPGFNDEEKDILAIRDRIRPYQNVTYELLPYHAFGENKYRNLGREYQLSGARLDMEKFERLKKLI